MTRRYVVIDLKSFYASVECVDRGLDPLTTYLAVADISRTDKTICLAVSPALKKALDVPGRLRLYELLDKAKRKNVEFIVTPPRMKLYFDKSQKIYNIYTTFVAPEDIHPYSVDEVFIDVTPYLKTYNTTAKDLATKMMRKVYEETGITATAGVGTNLYLSKIAMDILAKRAEPDENGARIAELDMSRYQKLLWDHQPITDFWRVGPGTARRLKNLGIHTMGELAKYSEVGANKLYNDFGVNAELLIDHAWGYEPVTMQDVKSYESSNHSLGEGQVLATPYNFSDARLILWEMIDKITLEMLEKNLVSDQAVVMIGYDRDNPLDGPTEIDHYGRKVPKSTRVTVNLPKFTNSTKHFSDAILKKYDEASFKNLTVRRIMISFNHIKQGKIGEKSPSKIYQADLFTDYDEMKLSEEKEERLRKTEIEIKKKYGKNAILKLKNYEGAATLRARNAQMGGHKA